MNGIECKHPAKVTLSVVVPIYNVERYLRQCLDSITASEAEDLEVVCVNDGSTDRSGTILREFAARDARVIVVEQSNRGLSGARNAGLAQTIGDYVLFVDSDDFVLPSEFDCLLDKLRHQRNVEMFFADYQMVTQKGNKLLMKPVYHLTGNVKQEEGLELLPKILNRYQCFWNVWRYVYKREFLLRNKLVFAEGRVCEDIDFTTRMLMAEPRTVFIHCPFYCYRVQQKDSLSGNITRKRVEDAADFLCKGVCGLDALDLPWRQTVISQYQYELIRIMALLYEAQPADRLGLLEVFRNALPCLSVGDALGPHVIYRICCWIGVKPVAAVLWCVKRIKRRIRTGWSAGRGGET